MWRYGVNPRTSEARLRLTGSRRKNRIFREVLYAPRFRPISEIGRRPGRGGYNYAVAGGAGFRSSGHRPPLYSTAELILRPGFILEHSGETARADHRAGPASHFRAFHTRFTPGFQHFRGLGSPRLARDDSLLNILNVFQ